MDVMYLKEFLTRPVIDELKHHLIHHQEEVKNTDEMDVDWPAYRALQEAGIFHFYTARAEGVLLGYIGYIIAPHLHHRGVKYALCDLIYVEPASRGKMHSVNLMKHAEADLVAHGVASIGQPVKVHHDFGPILKRQGYVLDEYYYTKEVH